MWTIEHYYWDWADKLQRHVLLADASATSSGVVRSPLIWVRETRGCQFVRLSNPPHVQQAAARVLGKEAQQSNAVVLHVRRGDYNGIGCDTAVETLGHVFGCASPAVPWRAHDAASGSGKPRVIVFTNEQEPSYVPALSSELHKALMAARGLRSLEVVPGDAKLAADLGLCASGAAAATSAGVAAGVSVVLALLQRAISTHTRPSLSPSPVTRAVGGLERLA